MEKKPCPICERLMKPRSNKGHEYMPNHLDTAKDRCAGSGAGITPLCPECGSMQCANFPVALSDPAPTVEAMDDTQDKGPWFGALYEGRCSVSECRIDEGDRIRADGQGGYECEDCGEAPDRLIAVTMTRAQALATLASDGPNGEMAELAFEAEQREAVRVLNAHPYATIRTREVTTVEPPTADEFMSPSSPDGPADELNVSGQPKARYEWRGNVNMGYLTKDPETGDFRRYKNRKPKGYTRATTFNKAASDSKAINDWGKRNIVIGASRRRDVLLRAHGLTHENDRDALTAIVAELEEAAGAKVGSDLGTYLHEFTEQMDAGLKTWRDAPGEFHRSLALYAQALADAGLEPVPGLIERTTMIREFGGVVGTFDRIFYHRPSGTYLIGDLKTGKTMEYAMDETNTQMWIYAHGVNQNGIYDWNTDAWTRDWNTSDKDVSGRYGVVPTVREDVGVIIHMPVQGPQAGTVTLVHADLVAGAKHAELCHAIRSRVKSKVRAFAPLTLPRPLAAPEPELSNPTSPEVWRALFRTVGAKEEATELWLRAKADGIAGVFLNELVGLAQQTLRGKG